MFCNFSTKTMTDKAKIMQKLKKQVTNLVKEKMAIYFSSQAQAGHLVL